ncbi:hypothetical protein BVRB_8g195880 [Beta vulgaris subsp. vulgaris]|nr:hypothetical protein BVRB_8g195880 [Beta vulgaris subsp. vulgaris]
MKFVVVESYSFSYVCVLGGLDKFMNYLVVEKKFLTHCGLLFWEQTSSTKVLMLDNCYLVG